MQRNWTDKRKNTGKKPALETENEGRDDSSSRMRRPVGKCCLLPQDVTGVTLLALLEGLQI